MCAHIGKIIGFSVRRRWLGDRLCSRLKKGTVLSPAHSLDITRKIDRLWHSRFKPRDDRVQRTAHDAGGERCPACTAQTTIAPIISEYRGNGVIHHHWLCRACGHRWVTVIHVAE
jgi:hypothetical protein